MYQITGSRSLSYRNGDGHEVWTARFRVIDASTKTTDLEKVELGFRTALEPDGFTHDEISTAIGKQLLQVNYFPHDPGRFNTIDEYRKYCQWVLEEVIEIFNK